MASWKLYVKKKKRELLLEGVSDGQESIGTATKHSAESGGCVFREGYEDKFSLRNALHVILDQGKWRRGM